MPLRRAIRVSDPDGNVSGMETPVAPDSGDEEHVVIAHFRLASGGFGHAGLVDTIGAVLPGASWQRCRTHYARNLLSQVPKPAQPWVATLLRTVFEQPDTDAVQAQIQHVLDALAANFPEAAAHLDTAQHDLLAFTAFPREIWRQIWSN